MTATPDEHGKDQLQVPLDLSEWCPKPALLAWIDEELATLDWANPDLVAYLRAHPDFQPRTLLRLLGFAYATGIFESEEIVRLSYADANFRALCNGAVPSARELGR